MGSPRLEYWSGCHILLGASQPRDWTKSRGTGTCRVKRGRCPYLLSPPTLNHSCAKSETESKEILNHREHRVEKATCEGCHLNVGKYVCLVCKKKTNSLPECRAVPFRILSSNEGSVPSLHLSSVGLGGALDSSHSNSQGGISLLFLICICLDDVMLVIFSETYLPPV